MGFPANAAIHTLSGPLSVGELASRCADGAAAVPIFTWDGIQITVGLASECVPVGEEQIYEIVLDEGRLLVSASTEFILRRGAETPRPVELSIGESLMPLYLRRDALDYPTYIENGTAWKRAIAPADRTSRRKVSRMVAEWKQGKALERGTYVEHIDGNKDNYHPDNLRIVVNTRKAHRSKVYPLVKAQQLGARVVSRAEQSMGRQTPNNHTVIDVRPLEMAPVFEFRVAPTDVAVMSGVFLRSRSC